MLVTTVLVAEVLAAGWFLVFSLMMLSMYLDSRSLPRPKLDIAGSMLIGNARLAFIAGIVSLAVLTVFEIPGLA